MKFSLISAVSFIVVVSFFVAPVVAARSSAFSPFPHPSACQENPCTGTCTASGYVQFNSPSSPPSCYNTAQGAGVTWDLTIEQHGMCSLHWSCPDTAKCQYAMLITVDATDEMTCDFTVKYSGGATIASCSNCSQLVASLGLSDPPGPVELDCYNTPNTLDIEVWAGTTHVWTFRLVCGACVG